MDVVTARITLHRWIDEADDTTIISLADLLTTLTTTIEQQVEARQQEVDRTARGASFDMMERNSEQATSA